MQLGTSLILRPPNTAWRKHSLKKIETFVVIITMKKLTPEQIARIQQLRRAGYPMATIGKLFGVDRSVIAYHTKNLPRVKLEDFLKTILPHLPLDGPPLPKGWSPTWNEIITVIQGLKSSSRKDTKGRNRHITSIAERDESG